MLDKIVAFGHSALVGSDTSEIDQLLRRRYVFRCLDAGVRLRDEDRRSIAIAVGHLMEPPSEQRHEWAPPTLQSLYAVANGLAMFCPEGTSWANLGASYGILFWSAEHVSAASEQFRGWVRDELRHSELTADQIAGAEERLSALVSIGRDCGGDAIVLDTSRRDAAGESPVLVLDHEGLLAAVLDADDEPDVRTRNNLLELLIALDQETLPFVESSWRYFDRDGPQYFVSSVEHAS